MSIQEAILAVTELPHSIQARARLAEILVENEHPDAEEAWEATVHAALARCQFFTALLLCQKHLSSAKQMEFYALMALLFSADRNKTGPRHEPIVLPSWSISIPEGEEEQVEMAYNVGTNLTGLTVPTGHVMPDLPIFGELSAEDFVTLAKEVRPVILEPEQVLIRQGDEEQTIYLLSHGEIKVAQKRQNEVEIELAQAKAPVLFGEMSIMTRIPRRATVSAVTSGLAWQIDSSLLSHLGQKYPALVEKLHSLIQHRLVNNMLDSSRLFIGIPENVRDVILGAFQILSMQAGSTVINQDKMATGLFILLHGEAEVWLAKDGASRTRLATLSEGDVFGEFSLLSGEMASAEVVMPRGGVLFYLSSDAFQSLRKAVPQLEENLKDQMLTRREQMHELVDVVSTEFGLLGASWLDHEAGYNDDFWTS